MRSTNATAWLIQWCLRLCTALLPSTVWAEMLLDPFDPMPDGPIYSFALQPDGNWFAAGAFTRIADSVRTGLARFHANGLIDESFAPDTIDQAVYSVVPMPDGKLMIGGSFTRIDGVARSGLARLHADGRLDTSFPDLGLVPLTSHGHMVYRIVLLRSGKLLIAGCFTGIAGTDRQVLVRIEPDGRIDPS